MENNRGAFGSGIRMRVDCGGASPEQCKVSPACSWHTRELMGRELDKVIHERDAYKKAKEENDERFMNERDEAREMRDNYKADMVKAQDLLWALAAAVWQTPEDDVASLTGDQCKRRMMRVAELLRAYGPEKE